MDDKSRPRVTHSYSQVVAVRCNLHGVLGVNLSNEEANELSVRHYYEDCALMGIDGDASEPMRRAG